MYLRFFLNCRVVLQHQSYDEVGIHMRHNDWLVVLNKNNGIRSCDVSRLIAISEIAEGLKFYHAICFIDNG